MYHKFIKSIFCNKIENTNLKSFYYSKYIHIIPKYNYSMSIILSTIIGTAIGIAIGTYVFLYFLFKIDENAEKKNKELCQEASQKLKDKYEKKMRELFNEASQKLKDDESGHTMSDPYHLKELWDFSYNLDKVKLTLKGHSRGSSKSCFMIPELKLYFDAGLQSPYDPEYIFVTHCHSDHSSELVHLVSYISKSKKKKPITYVPKAHKHLFDNYINSSFQLSVGSAYRNNPHVINGVEHGDTIPINRGNKNYFMKVYNLDHSVLACGYGLFEKRNKLKKEYIGIDKNELIALKKNKVEIQENVDFPAVVYLCDTTTKIFTDSPEVLSFPYVVVECTFLYDYEKEIVIKHIHWDDIKPIIEANKQCVFILIHFSMRYTNEEIKEFFDKQNIDNVYPWLN